MAQVEDAGVTEQAHGTDRPIRGSIEVTERLEKRQFGRFFGSYIRSKDSATVMHRVEKTLLKLKAKQPKRDFLEVGLAQYMVRNVQHVSC